jgi:hypothetical protein
MIGDEIANLPQHAELAADWRGGVVLFFHTGFIAEKSAPRQSTFTPPLWDGCVSHCRVDGANVRARSSSAVTSASLVFFSYLVSAEGSVERAALEGGNTESILRRHYLNLATGGEAEAFWQILPPATATRGKVVRMTAWYRLPKQR